jgi:hypothetical protein
VGGYWGLFDADRQDKNILAGSVSNLPGWTQWLAATLLLTLAFLLIAGRPGSVQSALVLPLVAGLGSASALLWAELALITSRFAGEWIWSGLLLLLNLLVLMHAVLTLSTRQGWRQSLFSRLEANAGWLLLASGFVGAVLMLGLVFDPRYRSFPTAALLLPALFYLYRPVMVMPREAGLLAALIGLGVPFQLYQEGLSNLQALGWALVSVLLAGALVRALRMSLAQRKVAASA